MFKERFLFLTNEATIGVFIVDSATVFVALSGNGEFVKVYRGDSSSIHLTRFCPVAAHLLVQKLLAFRNRYAHRPYFCDRFQKISAPFSGSRTISWSLQTKHQRTTKNCWTVYSDGNGRSLAAVCPFRRKLCYLSDAIFLPDTSIGHHRSQQASEFRVIRHVTVVPLAHAPAFFHGDYAREISLHNHDSSILSSCISTEIPMSIECGASDSSSACEFFHEIEHELTFLKSIRKYPTSIDFAVRVEKIDEEIFLSTSNYSHSQCCGTPETRTQDITVENWIQPQKIIGRIEMRTKISQQHSDEKVSVEDEKLDEKSLCVEDFGCNGDGPVLTLKGDYFTFYQHQSILSDNNDTSDGDKNVSALGLSIHVSLLDQYCEEIDCMEFEINLHLDDKNINKNKNENKDRSKNENMDEYENKTHDKNTLEKKITEDNEEIFSELRSMPSYHRNHSNVKRIFSGDHRCHKSDGNIRDREGSSSQIQNVLRTYRQHAIRLLEYREYLQPRMKHLNASSNIPLCLRSIYDEKKNSFSKERMQIANLPGGSSVREILGEQEQEHRCTHRPRIGHGQRREGEGKGERGYGGSYYIKDGDLHQIFCDDTDSLISSSSFSNGHDIHSSSSSSSRSSSSSSSSSKRFDVHRNTHTVNTNYDEYNTVKLHTSFGAKFTAFPFSPIISVSTDTSDTSYGWNSTYAHGRGDLGEGWGSDRSNRNAEDQIELERFSSRARSGFPQEGRLISEMFDRVRGVFPDRSQVDLCLKTKVVKALLPDGREIKVTLNECFLSPKALEKTDEIILLKNHLTSMISFHTFACISPEKRIDFMMEVKSRSSFTQAAMTRSERYLRIQNIQNGLNTKSCNKIKNKKADMITEDSRDNSKYDGGEQLRKTKNFIDNDTRREIVTMRDKGREIKLDGKNGFERNNGNERIESRRSTVEISSLENVMREALQLSRNAILSNSNLLHQHRQHI